MRFVHSMSFTCNEGRGMCMVSIPWTLSSTWSFPEALLPSPGFSVHMGKTPPYSLQISQCRKHHLLFIKALLIESQVSFFFTWRNGSADGGGGEAGEYSINSITEVLREEHMSIRWAARQFMELFPPYKRKTIFFKALNNKEINIRLMELFFLPFLLIPVSARQ